MKVEVWYSFAVEIDINPEEKDDLSFLARNTKSLLIDRINSDSIAECIEDVVTLEQ